MSINIVKGGARRPQMSCILFGPPGTWKTSTLACAQRALWLDFHGSTKTMGERPDCAWDPETGEGRPGSYPDLLGAEDHGLSKAALARCQHLVQLPGRASLNVAVAGSIVLYDRHAKAVLHTHMHHATAICTRTPRRAASINASSTAWVLPVKSRM